MNTAHFITGTDTGVGKTLVTVAMIELYKSHGVDCCGMKPVSSGGQKCESGHISEDARLIQRHSSVDLPFQLMSPLSLENACSPNIAAELEGKSMDLSRVVDAYHAICRLSPAVLVEGAGGWRSPCFSSSGMLDMVRALGIPVIIVVGIRLGCINHALLSVESILRDNVTLTGWIANLIDPEFPFVEKTLNYLEKQISAPLLGTIPYHCQLDYSSLHQYISAETLIGGNDQ